MDEKSLAMVEFPRIREQLAAHTAFEAGRELALALKPLRSHSRITKLLAQSAEARSLLKLDAHFTTGAIPEIREALKVAAVGGTLEPLTLLDIQQALAYLHTLRSSLGGIAEDFPLLWEIAGEITPLKHIEKDIGSCLDPAGEVLDNASPALASIRKQLRDSRNQILERLQAIIRSPRGGRILQEDIITEREGRYVILVKVECRHELKGIVHDISNTGATVYVEPTATVGLGNALRELVIEERREVERILTLLSAEVGASATEINANIALAADLDLTLAKARYARKLKAAEPVITAPAEDGSGRVLDLVEARHPLLGDKAVPFSVAIGRDFNTLIITGPNTGGKTVTLKTIGLLGLMAQAGIPIPARPESRLPIFDDVFADIGDEQSIEQTLSTFSWHVSNIVRIIKRATDRSLVLLDELGTSTDPTEGSALARAILRHFQVRGTMTVATSHFSDIKAFAHTTPGFENASLEFDPATLRPTYRLAIGIPGGSNAMATAARLGIPQEIIDEARAMLAGGSQELEELLSSLMQEKQRTEELRLRTEAERRELEKRRAELVQEQSHLREEEARAIREARDAIVRDAAELHRQIRQAATDLRREKSGTGVEAARQALAAVRQELSTESWQADTSSEDETDDSIIKVGDRVQLRDTGLTGTVLALLDDTQEVEVEAGRTRLRIGRDSVIKTGAAPDITAPTVRSSVKPKAIILELDLRGKRADEVEWAVDSYLSDAAQANADSVRIIHGHGTGTVRQIVRDFLAGHPLVKSFRSGQRDEGGDGATVARL